MINLHISIGNEESGNWESLKVVAYSPDKELYSDPNISDENFGIKDEVLVLPSGEELTLGSAFWAANNSINFVIEKDGETLLNIVCFKQKLENFDPSVVFKSPGGSHLSFMFSTKA